MKKYALVTGATSGIGKQIAVILTEKGYKVIACGRNRAVLSALAEQYGMIPQLCDLSSKEQCVELHKKYSDLNVTAVVNCAGFGFVRDFDKISVDDDVDMINVNITSLQILTKLFSQTMKKGVIMNVCSSAAFTPEPLMASYAASKAYVYSYSRAVDYELKKRRSRVHVCVICPGAVSTPFEKTAGVSKPLKGISAEKCAKCTVDAMEKRADVTIVGTKMKLAVLLSKLLSENTVLKLQYKIQGSKLK